MRVSEPPRQLRLWGAAFQAAQRATATAEDPQNAWYHVSVFHAQREDAREVEHCLRKASQAAPNWYKPHATLAKLLQKLGRHKEAQAEAARSIR
jgi:hypothetical protein